MNSSIKERLISIFERVGIFLEDDKLEDEIQVDSMQFAMVITYIEDEFNILLGDSDDVDFNKLKSFIDYYNVVVRLVEKESIN